MADSKITALTAITTVNPATYPLVIVDTSDTSMAITGTTKKVTTNQLLGSGGTATLASATITGDLTVDTSTLKVDSANNFVGVGTTTGVNLAAGRGNLTIGGSSSAILNLSIGATDTGYVIHDGTSIYLVNRIAAGSLIFSTNSTERFRIDSSGNVGIGVTPTNKLDVSSSDAAVTLRVNTQNAGASASNYSQIQLSDVGTVRSYWRNVRDGAGTTQFAYNSYLQFLSDAAGTPTERMRIDTSGNVGIGVTPSAGKGCLQLSSGINFPATQVASSDANTLDDYEEGTWTGTLKGGTTDPTTPVTATGRYTKIGRVVTLQINFANVNTTGASGNLFISGIPFTNSSVGSYGTAASYSAATFTGTLVCVIDPNDASSLILLDVKSNAAWAIAQHNAGTGRYVNATITYTV